MDAYDKAKQVTRINNEQKIGFNGGTIDKPIIEKTYKYIGSFCFQLNKIKIIPAKTRAKTMIRTEFSHIDKVMFNTIKKQMEIIETKQELGRRAIMYGFLIDEQGKMYQVVLGHEIGSHYYVKSWLLYQDMCLSDEQEKKRFNEMLGGE